MQSSTVRPLFNLTSFNRIIIRSLAVNRSPVNLTEKSLKPWQEIPGPSSYPIIGQLHHFIAGPLSDTIKLQENLYRLYGPIVRLNGLLGQAPILFIFDPESCATMLRAENWMPRRPGFQSLQYYRKYHNKTEEQSLKPTGLITERGSVKNGYVPSREGSSHANYPLPTQGVFCGLVSTWHVVPCSLETLIRLKVNHSTTLLVVVARFLTIPKGITVVSLYSDGENWKIFRSTVNPVMLQPKTIKLYSNVLEEVAQDMVTRMKSIRNDENMLEGKFDVEMNLWALESIGVVALGGRLNCFDPNLPEDSPARRLIQCVHQIFLLSNELDFKPSLWRYFATRKFKRAMKLYEEQESIAKYFVRNAMEELRRKDKKSDDEKGILEKLLEINEEIAVVMACDMLFAGVDTAANTMTSTLYYLAKNEEKQNKLREEIRSGDQRYLKACLKESMRIFPIVLGNFRQLTKDYNIMGYKIPKDMLVVFPHQSFSSWESQYPRAKEFIPERWLDKDSPIYHGQAHPFAYSPFGFGVRSCIGRRIAELEMETFLTKLIQNFQIEWNGAPPGVTTTSISYFSGPFHFSFKDV